MTQPIKRLIRARYTWEIIDTCADTCFCGNTEVRLFSVPNIVGYNFFFHFLNVDRQATIQEYNAIKYGLETVKVFKVEPVIK